MAGPAAPAPPTAQALNEAVNGATALLLGGDEDQARRELTCVLEASPDHVDALRLQRQITLDPVAELGDRAIPYRVRSGETIEELAQRFLGDPRLFYVLSRYNRLPAPDAVMTGTVLRIPEAAALRAGLKLEPADASRPPPTVEGLMRAARSAMARQDLRAAIAAWDRVLELQPGHAAATIERQRAVDLLQRSQSAARPPAPTPRPTTSPPAAPPVPAPALPPTSSTPPPVTPPPVAAPAPPPPSTRPGPIAARPPATSASAVARTPPAMRRHVGMEAPSRARPGQPIPVRIALTERHSVAGVAVEAPAGMALDREGRLPMQLPTSRSSWRIQVVLDAPGFLIRGEQASVAQLTLPRNGDSSPARFEVVARAGEVGDRMLKATLWHEGRYLGSASRRVNVGPGPQEPCVLALRGRGTSPAPGPLVAGSAPEMPVEDGGGPSTTAGADLYLYVRHDDPRALGDGQVIVASPHLAGYVTTGPFTMPADAESWLAQWYARLNQAVAGRGPLAAAPRDTPAQMAQRVAMMRGFGTELYERLAPPAFRRALERLLANDSRRNLSVQIYSNNPTIPWELMRPGRLGNREIDFLGTEFRVARWHTDGGAGLLDRPVRQLTMREVVVLAPDYGGTKLLPALQEEVAQLSRLRGFRKTTADQATMRLLAGAPPAGIVHFAGHGELRGSGGARREYLLQLQDGSLDATAWRNMARPAAGQAMYFFNACQLGQTDSIGGSVAGWAPALLDSGAGGYIGGLWALRDEAAAAFSRQFYEALTARSSMGSVADAAREARRLFFTTGDVTYLAYVLYGDTDLRVTFLP